MSSQDTSEPETDDTRSVSAPKPLAEITPPAALVPGAKVGRFVVVSEIGQGGMGAVYAAFDPDLNRKVAVKLLHAKAAKKGTEATIRLQREAQALARISHPNVVSVHDVGMHAGGVFIAMEFIEGVTLRDWAKDKTREQIVEAFCQAGEGLAAIHAVGLVHRDFKASNVVVSNDGRVRVLDLGLARLSGDIEANSLSSGTSSPESEDSQDSASGSLENPLTRVGDVTGTTGYIAPELFAGATATAVSDQFSFGVALYKALFDEMPFKSRTIEVYAASVRKGPPSSPPENSKVPQWLFQVIRRTLETAPEKRFGSMGELLRALRNDPTQARRRRAAYALATLAFVGAGVGVFQATNPPCMTATQTLESLWPVERFQQLETKLSVRRPGLLPVVRRGLTILDQRIREFAQVREEVCFEEHPRFAAVATSRRSACLSRKEQEFRVLLDTLDQSDELVASKSADLIRMSAVDPSCRYGLERRQADDVANEHLELARELRAELLKTTALRLIARFTESQKLALSMVERAHQAKLHGFEGEALYLAATAETELGENDDAAAHLQKALFLLMSGGVDALALQAIDRLMLLLSKRNPALETLKTYVSLAESLFVRMGKPLDLEFIALSIRSRMAKAEGKNDEQIAFSEQMTVVARKAFGQYSAESSRAWSTLSNSFWEAARAEDSLRASLESMKILSTVLGPSDPGMVWRYQDVADVYGFLGRDNETIPLLERAYDLALRVMEPDSVDLADVGTSLAYELTQSHPERALVLLNNSVAKYEKKQAPEELGFILRSRARAFVALNRGAEALADCLRADQIFQDPKVDQLAYEVAAAARCRGNAYFALHRYKEAVAELTRARSAKPPLKAVGGRARLSFELARARKAMGAPSDEIRNLCEQGLSEIPNFPAESEVKRELLSCFEGLPSPAGATRARTMP